MAVEQLAKVTVEEGPTPLHKAVVVAVVVPTQVVQLQQVVLKEVMAVVGMGPRQMVQGAELAPAIPEAVAVVQSQQVVPMVGLVGLVWSCFDMF